MKTEKVICQECGQQLTSWADKHTVQDCGKYHLKRAQEILGFNREQLERDNHNAEVLLKVADNEIAKLKESVYCQCEEPDSGDMDNSCARCGKVIEDHPLNNRHLTNGENKDGTT